MNPENAKTEEEFIDAIDTEKDTTEYNRLMSLATRAVSDGQRKFASAKLRGVYGVGDYSDNDVGEAPRGANW